MDDKSEREKVLDFLKRTAEAIAQMFGRSCETLIHDMSIPGHPILAIYNSHVSNRQPGSTEDIFGGDIAASGDTTHFKLERDVVNSLVITKNGHSIKSTTINYIGEGYHFALGINFDFSSLGGALSLLEDLTSTGSNLEDTISDYSNAQLEDIFQDCLTLVGRPVEAMKKNDRLQLIALMMQRNAFRFQKSITYVAERMNVSRYTIYKYCHEVEETLK